MWIKMDRDNPPRENSRVILCLNDNVCCESFTLNGVDGNTYWLVGRGEMYVGVKDVKYWMYFPTSPDKE